MTSISSPLERSRDALAEAARLHDLLADLARFGATPGGGVTRLCASAEDGEARAYFARALLDAGAEPRTDAVGNQFGLFRLTERSDAPLVMMGSHLDSQFRGGRFDGVLGVAAGLCVGRALLAARRTGAVFDADFCVVNWTNEEGARFRPSLLGSSTFVGTLDTEFALGRHDDKGISLGEALEAVGFRGNDAPPPVPSCYLELHIEQGGRLEEAQAQIGIVTRNWGAVKLDVAFVGEQAHTGPTAMGRRRDALLAAAQAIVEIRAIADSRPGIVHTSVGRIAVEPNSSNVVASEVEISIEVRAGDDATLEEASARLDAIIAGAAERARVGTTIRSRSVRSGRMLTASVCDLVERSAADVGRESLRMATISGHDALSLLGVCPSGIVFVPSIGGISHNEAEDTSAEDIEAGFDVCLRAAERLCSAGGSPERAVLLETEPKT